MFRTKILAGFTLVVVVLIAMFGTALAAPAPISAADDTGTATPTATLAAPITGTVQTITINTDANNVTTVEVTLLDANNVVQTVTLSLDEAVAQGLVILDANNVPSVNDAMIGQSITVQPQSPTPTPTPAPTTEAMQNPVGAIIASFFGLDFATVDSFHQDGSGYGVIAQACWMSNDLAGDASLCGDILAAKKSGDYSAFVLPDGSTPTNWGQFRKAVSENKGKQNLGVIVSGHASPLATPTSMGTPTPGPSGTPSAEPTATPSAASQPFNGNGMGPGNGNSSNGNGMGPGNGNSSNGSGNGNGNGNGHNPNGNGNGSGSGNSFGHGKGPK